MTLQEMLNELEVATKRLKDAEQREMVARMDCTQVRNEVNNMQKSIDAEIKKMKESASRDTDWHSERQRQNAVRVS